MKKKKIDNPNAEAIEPDPGEQAVQKNEPSADSFTDPGSDTAKLGRLKLQPYSPFRMIAAQAMGIQYGFLDDAAREQFKKTRLYPGMLRDVINHVWLRWLTDDFEIDRAARSPIGAARKAAEWAAKRGITDTSDPAFWEAWGIFIDAMAAIRVARGARNDTKKKADRKGGRAKR